METTTTMEAATTICTTFLIPIRFARLADCAAPEERRYGLAGVALVAGPHQPHAMATDGRIGARVPVEIEQNDEARAQGWTLPVIVPVHAWRHAFAKLPRGRARPEMVRIQVVRRSLASPWCWIARDGAGSILSGDCLDYRFPDLASVLAITERSPARFVCLDAGHLSRLASGLGLDASNETAPALVFTDSGPKVWGPVLVVQEGEGEKIAKGGTVPTLCGAIMPRAAS